MKEKDPTLEEININIRLKKTVSKDDGERYLSETLEVVKTFKSDGSIYDLIEFIKCGITAFEDENPNTGDNDV